MQPYGPPGGPGYGAPPPPPQRSGKPTAAGILNIIGGVIALLIMIWMLMLYMEASDQAGVEFVGLFGLGMVCLAMPLIGVIFAFIGGIAALKRKSWGLALVGSLIGMIFAGGIFCLIALILVAISKDDFR